MTISLFILPYQKHLLLIFLSQSVKWHILTQSSASNRVWRTLRLSSIAVTYCVHLQQLMRPSGTALFFRDENFLSIGLTLVTKHPGESPISCKYSNQMDPDFLSFQRPQISDSGVQFSKGGKFLIRTRLAICWYYHLPRSRSGLMRDDLDW